MLIFKNILMIVAAFFILLIVLKLLFAGLFLGLVLVAGSAVYYSLKNSFERR